MTPISSSLDVKRPDPCLREIVLVRSGALRMSLDKQGENGMSTDVDERSSVL